MKSKAEQHRSRAKKIRRSLDRDSKRTVKSLLEMEKQWGHHGVFYVIKLWLISPLRGRFGWEE